MIPIFEKFRIRKKKLGKPLQNIHLLNILRAYYEPGTVLVAEGRTEKKTDFLMGKTDNK